MAGCDMFPDELVRISVEDSERPATRVEAGRKCDGDAMTFRIVNDKAEAERIVREGGAVRWGDDLNALTELSDLECQDWRESSGPYVVVREPTPKPLTDEEIAAELERQASNCRRLRTIYGDAKSYGLMTAAKIIRERKL